MFVSTSTVAASSDAPRASTSRRHADSSPPDAVFEQRVRVHVEDAGSGLGALGVPTEPVEATPRSGSARDDHRWDHLLLRRLLGRFGRRVERSAGERFAADSIGDGRRLASIVAAVGREDHVSFDPPPWLEFRRDCLRSTRPA